MKLSAVVLFGAGYVVGTRAGRERYDQIVALARTMADRLEERTSASDPTSGFADRLAERIDASTRQNGSAGHRSAGETLGHGT